jgi:hypothetical protein
MKFQEIMNLVRDKKFSDVLDKLKELDNPDNIYTYIFKNLDTLFKKEAQPKVIIIVAKYADMASRARDPQITVSALATELMITPNLDMI